MSASMPAGDFMGTPTSHDDRVAEEAGKVITNFEGKCVVEA
jgi:hypothetical protein